MDFRAEPWSDPGIMFWTGVVLILMGIIVALIKRR